MNKIIGSCIAAIGLLLVGSAASACEGKPCGTKGSCPKGGGFYKEMDKNNDGSISKKEFDAFHADRFKEIDSNKDGKLSGDEMDALHDKMVKQGRQTFAQRFDEVDIDHDGLLSKQEAEIGMPGVFAQFDEADANKDGKLSKGEISAVRRQHREERGGMMKNMQP